MQTRTTITMACLLLLPVAYAQAQSSLHARALSVVEAERARARQPLCPRAMTTLDINTCFQAELATTDGNYLKLVRTLGALLRAGGNEKAPVQSLPFDDAEAAWQTYRDLACKAAGSRYEGGSMRPSVEMGCRLTATRHHMDELGDLYGELGTR